ncbi:flippase [Patescibacteria group bacterium]|nr:flippase [Patescibacteria group bacterium]MBU1673288.1 flippase [Patescibacteria group bacterium]MBU1963341.1 flippase [Patescibacteria group bacterium]
MPTKKSLTKQVFGNTLIQTIGKAVSLIISLWIARLIFVYLAPAGAGSYYSIIAFAQLFVVLLGWGTSLLLIKKLGQTKEKNKINQLVSEVFSLIFYSSGIFLILTFFLSFLIDSYSGLERIGILLASFAFIFIAFDSILNVVFQRELKTSAVAIAEVINKLLNVAWIYFAIYMDWGILGILSGLIAANLLNFIILMIASRRFVKIRILTDLAFIPVWLKESWPIAITLIFSMLYFKGNTVALKAFQPDAEVGYFSLPYRILEVAILFPPLYINLIMPRLAASWQSKDKKWFRSASLKSFGFLFLSAAIMTVLVMILSPYIVQILGGDEYEPSILLLKILIIAAGLMFLREFVRSLLITIEKQKAMMISTIIVSCLAIVLYILLIPAYGALGAAWITLGIELIYLIILVCLAWYWSTSS